MFGGASGLGFEVGQKLESEGHAVLALDIAWPTEVEFTNFKMQIDLCDPELNDKLLERLQTLNQPVGALHIFCGAGFYGAFKDQSAEQIVRQLEVNFLNPLLLLRAVLDWPETFRPKRVVFVGSVSAVLPARQHEVYGASKAALFGFVRSARFENNQGIKLSLFEPGPMKTAFHQRVGFPLKKTKKFMQPARAAQKYLTWFQGDKSFGSTLPGFCLVRRAFAIFRPRPWRGHINSWRGEGDVLLSGGSKGLGQELLKELRRRSPQAKILNLSRRSSAVRNVTDLSVDLGSPHPLAGLALQTLDLSKVKLCIHNAGYNNAGLFEKLSADEICQMVRVNLISPILITHELLRRSPATDKIHWICISSLSYQTGYPGSAVYAGAKDGFTHFFHSLRFQMKGRLSIVYPGPLNTEMAATNSPKGSSSRGRLAPDLAAFKILALVGRRKTEMHLSTPTLLFAWLGRVLPTVTEHIFKRALLAKFTRPQT